MSVAASRPSTGLTPILPPLSLKASFSLVFLAPVLAFSLTFFLKLLAMAHTPGRRLWKIVPA